MYCRECCAKMNIDFDKQAGVYCKDVVCSYCNRKIVEATVQEIDEVDLLHIESVKKKMHDKWIKVFTEGKRLRRLYYGAVNMCVSDKHSPTEKKEFFELLAEKEGLV